MTTKLRRFSMILTVVATLVAAATSAFAQYPPPPPPYGGYQPPAPSSGTQYPQAAPQQPGYYGQAPAPQWGTQSPQPTYNTQATHICNLVVVKASNSTGSVGFSHPNMVTAQASQPPFETRAAVSLLCPLDGGKFTASNGQPASPLQHYEKRGGYWNVPLQPGMSQLTVSWENGNLRDSHTVYFNVTEPAASIGMVNAYGNVANQAFQTADEAKSALTKLKGVSLGLAGPTTSLDTLPDEERQRVGLRAYLEGHFFNPNGNVQFLAGFGYQYDSRYFTIDESVPNRQTRGNRDLLAVSSHIWNIYMGIVLHNTKRTIQAKLGVGGGAAHFVHAGDVVSQDEQQNNYKLPPDNQMTPVLTGHGSFHYFPIPYIGVGLGLDVAQTLSGIQNNMGPLDRKLEDGHELDVTLRVFDVNVRF
jgi:hypothetical protein